MKLTIIIISIGFVLPCQAFVKCVNSDGHVQYGDECTLSNPVKKESMFVEETYDPDAAYQAEENTRELEIRNRQDAYERKIREARYRRINARRNSYNPENRSSSRVQKSYRSEWDDRRHCIYSCKKDPRCISGCY